MEIDASPYESDDGFPPHQRPEFREREILVAEAHADVVEQELRELDAGATFVRKESRSGIVRLEIQVDREFDVAAAIDHVRRSSAKRFDGFEPVLSPVHIVTTGQPNVRGNPKDALPRTVEVGLPARKSSEGEGVTVAVIDTGIAPHSWLRGGYVALPMDWEEPATVRYEDEEVLGEQAGHGVFLAGLVLEQAPGATVKVLKASDSNGRADIDAVAAAIARAAASDADIVSLSLGCFTRRNRPPWTLVQALADLPRTTAVVASAGNSSTSRSFWPGALARVVGIGALTEEKSGWQLAEYTNRGPWVDAYVPATNVLSTFIHYEGPALVRDPDGQLTQTHVRYGGWATWSGTSFAAATFSGALAHAVSELTCSPVEAARILLTEPETVSFARRLTLAEPERREDGIGLSRLALDFVPAAETAAAS